MIYYQSKGDRKIRKASLILLFLLITAGISHAISFNRIIYPIKTKDASGDILVQQQAPSRIISLDPAITEILFAFNLNDKIVGITKNCNYPEDTKKIEKVGGERADIGKIKELKPDLVLVNLEGQKDDMEKIRRIMIQPASPDAQPEPAQVFAVDPHSLRDIYNTISVVGTVTNKEHSAYSLLQRMKRRIGWVEAKAKNEKRIKALVVIKKRPLTVAAAGTYLNDLARACGFIDVAPRGKGMFPRMNRDEIEKADPDIIITGTNIAKDPKDIYNSGDFRKTGAGKNKKGISIDADIFLRPGPRVADALEEMARSAYGWPAAVPDGKVGTGGQGEEN